MAELFKMPRLGQSMEEGTILQWFKREGDPVKQGDLLLEVMSDKANIEVEATAEGVLRKILSPTDSTVPVNTPIAVIGTAEEPIDALLASVSETASVTADRPAPPAPAESGPFLASQEDAQIKVSPRARRLADEKGVPVSALAGKGTGPGGRILEKDVIAYLERTSALVDDAQVQTPRPRATPLAARMAEDLGVRLEDLAMGLPGSRVTADVVRRHAESARPGMPAAGGPPRIAQTIPFTGLRKLIADNVARSRQTAPHVTLVSEVDMGDAARLHAGLAPEFQRSHGTKLTFTDLLVKAAARALPDHPLCNAAVMGDEIRVYGDYNVGVAVALEAGLIVPVIHHADRRSLAEVSVELKALAERCRAGRQTQEDLAGGTFTITNLGAFGIDMFDPIIVPPQSCILGVGRIAERPVVLEGRVQVRKMMNLCLSFDHRVMDGVPAARFLQRVKEVLESPYQLLL